MSAPAIVHPDGEFRFRTVPWGRVLECVPLAGVAAHCFTSRDLDFRIRDGRPPAAWDALAAQFGVAADRVTWVRQVHGTAVACLERRLHRVEAVRGQARPEADVIVSNDPEWVIAVQVADCVPLLLADPITGAVAAAHAGWRGTLAGVAAVAVAALRERLGVDPGNLLAAIGPSIGPCCYEVGDDVRRSFEEAGGKRAGGWFAGTDGARPRLDLWRANRDQLVECGVRAERVHVSAICSATRGDVCFSYRRDGADAGRMVGAIRAAGA